MCIMEGNTLEKCLFQLRRIGAPATCKGIADTFRLHQGKTLIGRHLAVVDIYLNSSVNKQLISRQHAELWLEHHHGRQVMYLQDKSTNGTFVNDIKIHGKVKLEEGDTLTFGHTQGVRIQPGMFKSQPKSEFRFVLEKVHSENTPPQDDRLVLADKMHVVAPTPWHPVRVVNEPKSTRQLDQPVTHQGNGTLVLHDIPAVQPSGNQVTEVTTNKTESSIYETSQAEDNEVYSLHKLATSTCHQEYVHEDEYVRSLPCSSKAKQLQTACQSQSVKYPMDSHSSRTCNNKDEKVTVPHLSGEAVGMHRDQEDSSAYQWQDTSSSVRDSVKRRALALDAEISDPDKHTDDDLLELTSVISAKNAEFSTSDSEELDGLFQSTSPKKTASASMSVNMSGKGQSESHLVRALSPVLLCDQTRHSPESTMPLVSAYQQVTTGHTDSLSTTSTSQIPVKTDEGTALQLKKQTAQKSTDESQYGKRGGSISANKKKKRRRICLRRNIKAKKGEAMLDSTLTRVMEAEVCDSYDCCQPTDSTVDWVQCDGCDKWYHVACVGCDYDAVRKDSAAFHCGCT